MNDNSSKDSATPAKIRQALDQQPLQRSTIEALDQARHKALQPQPPWIFQYAKPALTFASVCAITLAIFLNTQPSTPEFNSDSVEAFEMLSNNDALEMYENLEFYLWLEGELQG